LPRSLVARKLRGWSGGIRKQYKICTVTPVDIPAFAEFDLKLTFDFKPIAQFGQDAFLLRDLSGIVFDDKAFEQRNENGLRFSVAHELGHLYLHRALFVPAERRRGTTAVIRGTADSR
jgi:hypothetical protein